MSLSEVSIRNHVFAWMLMLLLLWPVLLGVFLHKRWLFDIDEAVGSCFDNTVGEHGLVSQLRGAFYVS